MSLVPSRAQHEKLQRICPISVGQPTRFRQESHRIGAYTEDDDVRKAAANTDEDGTQMTRMLRIADFRR